MSRRERLVFYMILATLLAACGTSALQAPTLAPTEVFPTRVAVQRTGNAPAGVQPTTVPQAASPTLAPTLPPATPISPSPTRSFATVTPQVTATVPAPAAPAGNSASGTSGNPANGKTIFQNGIGDPAVPACNTCHNTDTTDVKIGPSLKGLASRAGSRVPGQDAGTYLHTSIVQPNAFLVPNDDGHVYSAAGTSLMFQDYAKHLSDAQVGDLVAYLLTLK